MTTLYRGRRDKEGRGRVTVTRPPKHGRPLRPRFDLFNHSPTGFEWGYEGSGPAQLALALLADALGDDDRAVRLHQPFKRKVIALLPRNERWLLAVEQILALADQIDEGNR